MHGIAACKVLITTQVFASCMEEEKTVPQTFITLCRSLEKEALWTSLSLSSTRRDSLRETFISQWRDISGFSTDDAPFHRKVELSARIELWLFVGPQPRGIGS